VLLAGGGAFNPTLRHMLSTRTSYPLRTLEDMGLRSDAREAVAFAIMAHETMLGHETNVVGATGAARRVVMGKIVPAVCTTDMAAEHNRPTCVDAQAIV
jgi:anhydro-N-acetylmuramic acid kinase